MNDDPTLFTVGVDVALTYTCVKTPFGATLVLHAHLTLIHPGAEHGFGVLR